MPIEVSTPFFSVVVPVFNRFELLKETVRSVLEQNYTDFEIIIVDDGSTDGTSQLLDEHFGSNPVIRIIHQENLERGAARNRGFGNSRGEYVIFLDSDDRLLPDHLQILYDKIKMLGSPDFISTRYEFLKNGKRRPSSVSNLPEGNYNYKLFLDGNVMACNVCVRRKNEKLILFEEDRRYSIKEDWLFFLRNLRYQQLYFIGEATLLMLDHEDRSMRGNNDLLIAKTFLARDWIIQNVPLDSSDVRQLDAHINYFCAIHSYLDLKRKKALQFIFRAFERGGIKKKYISLFFRIMIGRKIILLLKNET